jgi:D-serine deaminase-like pyridoxal phosphate-dependent protein
VAIPAERLETQRNAPPASSEAIYRRYESAFESIEAPFALVDLDAMWWNAGDMLRRAGAKPIRVATKSIRCRAILEQVVGSDPGFEGLLTYTLPETLFLAKHGFANLVLAYPTADRRALGELAELTRDDPQGAPALMVDSASQLDMIEGAAGPGGEPVRVCMELDVSYWIAGGRVKIGVKRSPVRTVDAAVALAREIDARPGVRLVGLMAYEGHIAGLGDRVPGRPLRSALIRRLQRASAREIRERRTAVVEALSEIAELEFVNGGGTGSIELTVSEPCVTEVAAGSGFYAPTLFDNYSAFTLRPAAMFALPIVRKPSHGIATALGGGYIASGIAEKSRLPTPYLPPGLRLDSNEGAGEVQTPLLGPAARELRIGDRVYFRHAKAGELCERFNSLYLVEGDEIVDEVPTYRGEGQWFL